MFEQLDGSSGLGKKTPKEKLIEGMIIVAAVGAMVGIVVLSFYWA
ncbi:MAG: hypothetical protein U0V70_19535 [Terriglobia bacterium]